MQWKTKFFVLKDNLFMWFGTDKAAAANQKPKGIIYAEEARVYEISAEEAPGKKENSFLVDAGKNKVHLYADTQEDMKSWMTDLRVAKKKKLGVKVVSEAGK